MAIKVAKAIDFPGEAQVTLIGLPNKVTTDVKKITKDTTDLIFHIKTDKVSPAGNHASLFCQVVITQNGEPIVHNIGTGTLRIDVPLPPKPNAPARRAGEGRRGSQAARPPLRQAAHPAGEAPAGEQGSQDRRQVSNHQVATAPTGRRDRPSITQGLDRNEPLVVLDRSRIALGLPGRRPGRSRPCRGPEAGRASGPGLRAAADGAR